MIGREPPLRAETCVPKRACYRPGPWRDASPPRLSAVELPGGVGAGDPFERIPLLALLDPDLRRQIATRLHRHRVGAGKPLYRQSDTADDLYLNASGRLRVFSGDRAGNERVLRFLGPSDVVGEAAFMAETPAAAQLAERIASEAHERAALSPG